MEQYYEPITAENRYQNEMMDHMRRQTIALEQLAQLLQPQPVELKQAAGAEKRTYTRRNKRGPHQ